MNVRNVAPARAQKTPRETILIVLTWLQRLLPNRIGVIVQDDTSEPLPPGPQTEIDPQGRLHPIKLLLDTNLRGLLEPTAISEWINDANLKTSVVLMYVMRERIAKEEQKRITPELEWLREAFKSLEAQDAEVHNYIEVFSKQGLRELAARVGRLLQVVTPAVQPPQQEEKEPPRHRCC